MFGSCFQSCFSLPGRLADTGRWQPPPALGPAGTSPCCAVTNRGVASKDVPGCLPTASCLWSDLWRPRAVSIRLLPSCICTNRMNPSSYPCGKEPSREQSCPPPREAASPVPVVTCPTAHMRPPAPLACSACSPLVPKHSPATMHLGQE